MKITRIQEDYLRILRFFRFSAEYGEEPYDKKGLKACTDYASHLTQLSRERVTDEFLKILSLSSPLYALKTMDETGVLRQILHPQQWAHIEALIHLEKATKKSPSSLLRLAALISNIEDIEIHLRLSKKQLRTVKFLRVNQTPLTQNSFKQQIYKLGKEMAFELIFFQLSHKIASKNISLTKGTSLFSTFQKNYDAWEIPLFPLTGHDVLNSHIPQGEKVGTLLKMVQQWWLEKDLIPDKDACLAYLNTLLSKKNL